MQSITKLARGIAQIEVECVYPERFLNLCGTHGIEFWDMKRSGLTIKMSIRSRDVSRLRALSPVNGFELKQLKKRGAPAVVRRFRKRYVLVIAAIAVFALIRLSTLFVWEINVSGNSSVDRAEILSALSDLGFRVGTYIPDVNNEEIANLVIMRIPELSWLAININGSGAEVLVRERIPKPEMYNETEPARVVAAKSGLITKLTVLAGAAVTEVGATVQAGDEIISSRVDLRTGSTYVHAMGTAEARTWYEFSACTPLNVMTKQYTGGSKTKRSVVFAGKAMNLYFSDYASDSYYDKTETITSAGLPGGVVFPLSVTTAVYREYETVWARITEAGAESVLKSGLMERLRDEIGESGAIVEVTWETVVENDVMTVYMTAECFEQIGVTVGLG